jgi:hypothetical protein
MLEMDFKEVKETLEALKSQLLKEMQNPNLSSEEKEKIQKSIINYEYIIELTDINHFERGSIAQ